MAFDRIKAHQSPSGSFDQAVEIRRALIRRLQPKLEEIVRTTRDAFNQKQKLDRLLSQEVEQHRASEGICHSLCLDWMKRKLTSHGADPERMDRIRDGVDRAIGRQRGFDEAMDATDAPDPGEMSRLAAKDSKERLGLKEVGVVAKWQSITADIAAKSIKKNMHEGLLMNYSLGRQDYDPASHTWSDMELDGGHSVAWYLSAGFWGLGLTHQHVYLFDPNCGEYRFRLSELGKFVADYLLDVRDAFSVKDEHGKWVSCTQVWQFTLIAYVCGRTTAQSLEKRGIVAGLKKNIAQKK